MNKQINVDKLDALLQGLEPSSIADIVKGYGQHKAYYNAMVNGRPRRPSTLNAKQKANRAAKRIQQRKSRRLNRGKYRG